MKIDANAPAFPLPIAANDGGVGCAADLPGYHYYSGLTVRAEIASRCLAGMLSSLDADTASSAQEVSEGLGISAEAYMAGEAVKLADALIAELNKGNGQ